MRADAVVWTSRRSSGRPVSGKRPDSGGRPASGRKEKARYLDLSLDGLKDLHFSQGENDYQSLPHGGHKGLKKYPLGIHSFNRGGEYQKQVREGVAKLFEQEHLDKYGSPRWALKVHRLPTHGGDSPLFVNDIMSPSQHGTPNGHGSGYRERRNTPRGPESRCSSARANKTESYYRPNSTHQYLSATDLRDATDCFDMVRYGRPTRTTLLRARQRVGSASVNAYERRRQEEQRVDEIRSASAFSNPREFVHEQSDVDGVSFHSFLTGARYNSAHCLDSKSVMQYGVYMPRNNPLGCFVLDQKLDITDSTTAPDSPRSAIEEGSRPKPETKRRPTTAPAPSSKTSPTSAMRSSRLSCHTQADNFSPPRASTRKTDSARGGTKDSLIVSPRLSARRNRRPVTSPRETTVRMERRLPFVHGKSLARLRNPFREENAVEAVVASQPPPSPVLASARGGNALPPPDTEELPEDEKLPSEPQQPPSSAVDQSAGQPVDQPVDQPADQPSETPAEQGTENGEDTAAGPDKKADEDQSENCGEQQETETAAQREKAGGQEDTAPEGQGLQEGETEGTVEETMEEEGAETAQGDGVSADDGNSPKEADRTFVEQGGGNVPAAEVGEKSEQVHDDTQFTTLTGDSDEQTMMETDLHTPSGDIPSDLATPQQTSSAEETPSEQTDDTAFFVTETKAVIGDADDVSEGLEKIDEAEVSSTKNRQREDDRASSASSRRSRGKRSVSFKEEPHLVHHFDVTDNGEDPDMARQRDAAGRAGRDADLEQELDDDDDQPADDSQSFNVIVTHIERSMGAPVHRDENN